MKRSEINLIIQESIDFFDLHNFKLPPFGYYRLNEWKLLKEDASEIFDIRLGWDVTDFGSNNFENIGLILFTVRNGRLGSNRYPKTYTEKIMIQKQNQVTPMHFHSFKMEDIINRGGGVLTIQIYNANDKNELSDTDVIVSSDGIVKNYRAGSWLNLKPGESITLPKRVYHTFHAENNSVLIGEVSMVNDDHRDNFFLGGIGRFPEIEEDVNPIYLTVNDYSKFLN